MSKDDLERYIRRKMREGIKIGGGDFAGWECVTCDKEIPFDEVIHDRDAVVVWDIEEADPGEEPTGYWHRYYFCSEECKREARRNFDTALNGAESDVIREQGAPVIAEGDVE